MKYPFFLLFGLSKESDPKTKRAQGHYREMEVILTIRRGVWGHYTIAIIRNPQNSIGNYLGPYIIDLPEDDVTTCPVRNLLVILPTKGLLGGSWVVRSVVISRVTVVITHIRGLISILTTTHEPPSRA